jgi:hypothetical protein
MSTQRKIYAHNASERFWKFVKIGSENECWLWMGGTTPAGYGRFDFANRNNKVGANRFSYELAFGKIPSDLCVLHRCDNPRCVNPNHLFVGTHLDNTQDAIAKNRWGDRRSGGTTRDQNGNAKLTEADVRELLIKRGRGATTRELAELFPMTRQGINYILRKESR